MSRRQNTGSIFWGLVLVTIGVVFLLRNIGFDIPIWNGIARYWPLLIIIWGVLKLVDYVHTRGQANPRPLFSAGEVALLIVVILAGSAITTAANMSPTFGDFLEIADIDLWEVTGNNYDYTEHYEMDGSPGSTIEITNRYGSVEVRPSDGDRIIVDVAKTVVAQNQQDANQLSEVLKFSIVRDSSVYRVISNFNRDQNEVRGRRIRTSLTIRVPRQSNLRIDNRNGDVTIADLTGNQAVTNGFAQVDVRGITGDLEIENRNGDVIAENISGSVTIDNGFAMTTARNVGGRLELETRNGDVEVSDVAGDTTIDNSFASVRVRNVEGQLSVSGRNSFVEVDGVARDLTVESSFNNIDIRNSRGAVTVRNRNGDVSIVFLQPPTLDVSVDTEFSNVTLEIPSTAAFAIDARTRFGRIESDFSTFVDESGPEVSSSGRVGEGGPLIRVETRNGDVRLQRRG